jgi:predicted HTH domain antitoxin
MTIAFDIPGNIEHLLQQSGQDPSQAAKEALLVELYRQEKISHGELAQALGLSRCGTDVVLKRHNVTEDLLTPQELATQVAQLRERLRQ